MTISLATITNGDGVNFPKAGDTVVVNYVGRLENGPEFDASHRHGRSPFTTQVGVGSVIKAWDEVLPQLSVGQRVRFTAPPEKAYGAKGFPPVIPPNTPLTFELQLLSIR